LEIKTLLPLASFSQPFPSLFSQEAFHLLVLGKGVVYGRIGLEKIQGFLGREPAK
jgi:hypothetical protein